MKQKVHRVGSHSETSKNARFDISSKPPLVFNEKNFSGKFNELVEEKHVEPALDYILDCMPKLHNSKMNRKEKMNHLLYMTRQVQQLGTAKYGYEKLLAKIRQVKNNLKNVAPPKKGAIVELGCGVHDAVALSVFFYLNGYDRSYAIDIQPLRQPAYSAISLYDILANVSMFPERYVYGNTTPEQILERLATIDVELFEKGDFKGGMEALEDKISYQVCDIAESEISQESVAVLFSFAVYEHLMDVDGVNKKIFNALLPGGYAYHFIDIADHRSYSRRPEYNPFTFLTESVGPKSQNRLRKSEFLEAFSRCGFEIIEVASTQMDVPAETREKILPKWSAMSDEDIETIKLRVLLKKPE